MPAQGSDTGANVLCYGTITEMVSGFNMVRRSYWKIQKTLQLSRYNHFMLSYKNSCYIDQTQMVSKISRKGVVADFSRINESYIRSHFIDLSAVLIRNRKWKIFAVKVDRIF
jgi:hypothetical protein